MKEDGTRSGAPDLLTLLLYASMIRESEKEDIEARVKVETHKSIDDIVVEDHILTRPQLDSLKCGLNLVKDGSVTYSQLLVGFYDELTEQCSTVESLSVRGWLPDGLVVKSVGESPRFQNALAKEEPGSTNIRSGERVTCKVEDVATGGYEVTVAGAPGFLPTVRQIALGQELQVTFVCMHNKRMLLADTFVFPQGVRAHAD